MELTVFSLPPSRACQAKYRGGRELGCRSHGIPLLPCESRETTRERTRERESADRERERERSIAKQRYEDIERRLDRLDQSIDRSVKIEQAWEAVYGALESCNTMCDEMRSQEEAWKSLGSTKPTKSLI